MDKLQLILDDLKENNIGFIDNDEMNKLYDYFGDARSIFGAKRSELEKIKNITEKKILAIENSKNIEK